MATAASRNSPTLQISAAQLGLGVLIQIVVVSVAVGALFQRVEAQERITAPIAAGELVKLDERVRHIQDDVAWIRQQMEKADRQ